MSIRTVNYYAIGDELVKVFMLKGMNAQQAWYATHTLHEESILKILARSEDKSVIWILSVIRLRLMQKHV